MRERLVDVSPELELILTRGTPVSAGYLQSEIRRTSVFVSMRDGVRLATDIYLPPGATAPSIAVRTPYGRAAAGLIEALNTFARAGYAVVSQDCRGTGDSEPESWDYYVYEREDSLDFVEWVSGQPWFEGFLGGCGGSYLAQTQWCMALHPRMSAIAPEVGGLGVAFHTARLHMFLNAYARSVGKGGHRMQISVEELEHQMLPETLAGGYSNEPLYAPLSSGLLERFPVLRTMAAAEARLWLLERYRGLGPSDRARLIKNALGEEQVTIGSLEALPSVFGHRIAHDSHMFACAPADNLYRSLYAPALMITGWYDWGLNDALATWEGLTREATASIRRRSRLIIGPNAHNMPGFHEGKESHPELARNFRTPNIADLLVHWYAAVRGDDLGAWPVVMYYLMGANEWQAATAWPPSGARPWVLHLGSGGSLTPKPPQPDSPPDRYTYDPANPTPTVGGSIVSTVYPPGSVDVSDVQQRSDVLTYTTAAFERSIDVVGPLRLILYASSTAVDTDFSARLSDVFPDGRAIQIQSGLLRARYRHGNDEPQWLEPGRIYRFDIDMWATANRFRAGHRLRVDLSSADFPRFDRNANRGGEPGTPLCAQQTVYHDAQHPSQFITLCTPGNVTSE